MPPTGSTPSIRCAEVPAAGEDHRHVVSVGDFDRHLVADRATGLDDRRDARPGRGLDAVGEREVGVRGEDRELGPVARAPDRDLDRDLAAGLAGADPDGRAVAREDDRVRANVPHRAPGEQHVGQLLEGRPTLGHDLEPAAIEPELVLALDQQAAGDALEVEAGDAVVAHAVGRVGRDRQQLEPGLAAQDADRRLAEPGRHDRLVRVRRDLARRRAIELAVDPDDPAEGRHRIGLEGVPVGLDQLVVRGQPDRVGVLDDGHGRRRVVARDPVGRVEIEQVVERRHLALQPGRIGERPAAVRRLAVERGALVRVLAVAQVVDLLEDEREMARERVARDLVEVGGDLGVIGGDRAERLGGELRPQSRGSRRRARAAPR